MSKKDREKDEEFILNGGLDVSSFVSEASMDVSERGNEGGARVELLRRELEEIKKALGDSGNRARGLVQEEGTLVKEAVRVAREVVAGLRPEDVYFRLKDAAEESLSLSEWVLVKVCELARPLERDLRAARLEISALREELRFKNEKLKLAADDRINLESLLAEKERRYKNFEACLELSKKDLEGHLEASAAEIRALQTRLAKEGETATENRLLKEDVKLLEHRLRLLDPQGVLQKHRVDASPQVESQSRSDAESLTRENRRLTEELLTSRRETEALRLEAAELAKRHDRFVERLLDSEASAAAAVERRLAEEIKALRARHMEELALARRDAAASFAAASARASAAEASAASKDAAVAELAAGHRDMAARVEGELVELRVTARLRGEACETLTAENAALRAKIEALAAESAGFAEKVIALRGELAEARAQAVTSGADLRAEVALLKKTLASYEAEERDMDSGLPQGELTLFARRGQQLRELNRKIRELEARLEAETGAHISTKDQLESVKTLYDKMRLPGGHLLKALEGKEEELLELKKKLGISEAKVKFLEGAAEKQAVYHAKVIAHVEELEKSRREVEQTRALLAKGIPSQQDELQKTKDFGKPKWIEALKKNRKV